MHEVDNNDRNCLFCAITADVPIDEALLYMVVDKILMLRHVKVSIMAKIQRLGQFL